MVHDEAGGVAQAVRAEARPVTVTCRHQQVNAPGNYDDNFTLDPAATMEQPDVLPPEPCRRGGEDRRSLLVLDVSKTAARTVPRQGPPEQPSRSRFGHFAHIGGRDVQERDLSVRGDDLGGSVDAALPCPLDDPDHDPHRCIIPRT